MLGVVLPACHLLLLVPVLQQPWQLLHGWLLLSRGSLQDTQAVPVVIQAFLQRSAGHVLLPAICVAELAGSIVTAACGPRAVQLVSVAHVCPRWRVGCWSTVMSEGR